jgi:hypothetical protein
VKLKNPTALIAIVSERTCRNAYQLQMRQGDGENNIANAAVVARELHWLERLNIVGQLSLVAVGIIAASIYGCQLHTMNGQLEQMKGGSGQTERLLGLYQQQLSEMQKQNELTKSLVRSDQAAIVDFSITGEPIGVDSIVAGIGAQFVNKGKTDATDFRATIVFRRVTIPSLKPMGKLTTITLSQDRLLPLSGGHGGFESVAYAVFDTSNIRESDIADIRNETSSIEMESDYSYGNGFGDTVRNSQCFLFVYAPAKKSGGASYATWEGCKFGAVIYKNYLRKDQ